MRFIVTCLLLIPSLSQADALNCSSFYGNNTTIVRGHYEELTSMGLGVFKTDDNKEVLFSFANCVVIRGEGV